MTQIPDAIRNNPDGAGAGTAPAPGSRAEGSAVALAPSDVDFMPSLLRSLATLLRLKGRSVSARSLMAGLAGEGRVTPAACLRAAEKVGLRGRILYRETLDNISPLTLPCALLLRHDRSCVLLSLRSDRAEVIFPEDGEAIRVVSAEDLGKEYSGYALFASPEAAPDRRAEALRLSRGPRSTTAWCRTTPSKHCGPWPRAFS